jgi:hypothetical protein
MASYEVRFLLTIQPLVAVAGAHLVIRLWDTVKGERKLRPALQIGLVVILLVLAIPSARKAVMFKGDILRHPLMNDAERHRVRLGPIYDVAVYLNDLPAEGTILSDNYYLPFHSDTPVVVGSPTDREHLAPYTYLVLSPGHSLPASIDVNRDIEPMTVIGGFTVYKVASSD